MRAVDSKVSSWVEDVEAGETLVDSITDAGPKAFERMGVTLAKLVKMLKAENPEANKIERRARSATMARHLHS